MFDEPSNKYKKEAKAFYDLLIRDGDYPIDPTPMEVPSWYNDVLYKRAQRFYSANIYTITIASLVGLVSVLSIPSILKLLEFTNASSIPLTAYKRYQATILHVAAWYETDLKEGTRAWKSFNSVKRGHIAASKMAQRSYGGIINQRDMVITQFGFMGYIIAKPHLLGIPMSRENCEAMMHFWRVCGHMIGIEDKYNLCSGSLDEVFAKAEYLCEKLFRSSLENSDKNFDIMATSLLVGLWVENPFLVPESFIYFTKMLAGCNGYEYFQSDLKMISQSGEKQSYDRLGAMNWYARMMLCFQICLHRLFLNFAVFRWCFNSQIHITNWLMRYFPFLAIYVYGYKNAYVRILEESKS